MIQDQFGGHDGRHEIDFEYARLERQIGEVQRTADAGAIDAKT
jgi:hypothetical protein